MDVQVAIIITIIVNNWNIVCILISASLKARANMSSESVISKMTNNNSVKQNVCKVATVDLCYQMSQELVPNQPSNVLKVG